MCMVNGLLELWSFDEMQISSLTKEDILRKINQPTLIRYVLISTILCLHSWLSILDFPPDVHTYIQTYLVNHS